MSSVIESTIKALVEFESELDRAKSEAAESKKKLIRDSAEWAAAAKAKAIAEAQRIASETVAKARAEAEAEAASIKSKGAAALKTFEDSISNRKGKAADAVATRLLGESP